MRTLVLALVAVVGCADGVTLSMDAPDPGQAHDGAAGAGGGAAGGAGGGGPTCDAPVESLSGTAQYVDGSAVATNPNLEAPEPYRTCGAYVAAIAPQIMRNWPVTNGTVTMDAQPMPLTLDTSVQIASGCMYVLRGQQFWGLPSGSLKNGAPSSPCFFAAKLDLVVP